ncbi:histidine--tRNA ligase [bacterium]|nr:histidine--tRNA ligase [bacterium]MBU1153708.1 histidine--tRNA ligase [bacterium]MBU2600162.1 histidine--tRNA ligase [bacterium]
MMIEAPRGTKDILPSEVKTWHFIEETSRRIFEIYGYQEIRTPIFEFTELFTRGIGEWTDIVNKEMYTFQDRKGRNLTLRPENTASIVRAYLENNLSLTLANSKLYYLGPMFRYERPQAGRQRQFWQLGSEVFGSNHPGLDAEVVAMVVHLLTELGMAGLETHINSLGCNACRNNYKLDLINYLLPHKEKLCQDCKERLNKNPLRVLDCKRDNCKVLISQAPAINLFLCQDCQEHLDQVSYYLRLLNLPYIINPHLVRGLDYYTHTIFEVIDKNLGAQNTIAAGGRYNNLIAQMGGPDTSAIGFAAGIERIVLSLERSLKPYEKDNKSIYLATISPEVSSLGIKIVQELRETSFIVNMDWTDKSLKSQLRKADKLKAKFTIILGEEEKAKHKVLIRDMEDKSQEEIPIEKIKEYFIKKFYLESS